jgi:hypothetical protein
VRRVRFELIGIGIAGSEGASADVRLERQEIEVDLALADAALGASAAGDDKWRGNTKRQPLRAHDSNFPARLEP